MPWQTFALSEHSLVKVSDRQSSVEEIHSVGTNNNVETSFLLTYFHRAVNNQGVIKMSDGHRNVVIR